MRWDARWLDEELTFCAANATIFAGHRADAEAWAAILFGEGATVTPEGRIEF